MWCMIERPDGLEASYAASVSSVESSVPSSDGGVPFSEVPGDLSDRRIDDLIREAESPDAAHLKPR